MRNPLSPFAAKNQSYSGPDGRCAQLEDPFFDPSGEDCELYFETGSKDDLERLMRFFILTERDVEAHEDEEIRLYAAMEGTETALRHE